MPSAQVRTPNEIAPLPDQVLDLCIAALETELAALRRQRADRAVNAFLLKLSQIVAAKQMFDAAGRTDRSDHLRRALAAVEREQARCTEAIATGAGTIPALVERLHTTDVKRRALAAELEQARQSSPSLPWRAIERRIRQTLTDWRSLITGGDVVRARQGFREFLTSPIRFTPCAERGFRAIRFEGQIGLATVFDGMVTSMASPTRTKNNYVTGSVLFRVA